MAKTQIEVRRPWRPGETIFLLGPGGVGKSTLGRQLAEKLGWGLVDLDLEFCERLETIGKFIASHGYERYRAENLALAKHLVTANPAPHIFVTPSGFLAAQAGTYDYDEARRLVSTGYGIVLLPSLDIEVATAVVVERQLKRGFGFQDATEDRKFRERFPIYLKEGNALVASMERPADVADAVIRSIAVSRQSGRSQQHSLSAFDFPTSLPGPE